MNHVHPLEETGGGPRCDAERERLCAAAPEAPAVVLLARRPRSATDAVVRMGGCSTIPSSQTHQSASWTPPHLSPAHTLTGPAGSALKDSGDLRSAPAGVSRIGDKDGRTRGRPGRRPPLPPLLPMLGNVRCTSGALSGSTVRTFGALGERLRMADDGAGDVRDCEDDRDSATTGALAPDPMVLISSP